MFGYIKDGVWDTWHVLLEIFFRKGIFHIKFQQPTILGGVEIRGKSVNYFGNLEENFIHGKSGITSLVLSNFGAVSVICPFVPLFLCVLPMY